MTRMGTYLLTWNPAMWGWDDLGRTIERVRHRGEAKIRWSTGNTYRILPGERVFMLKQGDGVRGIFGAGTTISDVFEDDHYDDARAAAGERSPYVWSRINVLLDPNTEELLTT